MKLFNFEFLNEHKVGLGTVLSVVIFMLWGSYELGTRGWEGLNAKFVDHAEANDHVTWTDYTIMDKKKNVRILKGKIMDLEIEREYANVKDEPAVVAKINATIIRIESTIEDEEESIECLEAGEENCEL